MCLDSGYMPPAPLMSITSLEQRQSAEEHKFPQVTASSCRKFRTAVTTKDSAFQCHIYPQENNMFFPFQWLEKLLNQGCPTFWLARATLSEEELPWATYKIYDTVNVHNKILYIFIYLLKHTKKESNRKKNN